jgi:hypothetical protein
LVGAFGVYGAAFESVSMGRSDDNDSFIVFGLNKAVSMGGHLSGIDISGMGGDKGQDFSGRESDLLDILKIEVDLLAQLICVFIIKQVSNDRFSCSLRPNKRSADKQEKEKQHGFCSHCSEF